MAGLYVVHGVLDPAPLPALGVVIGGLVAYVAGVSGRAVMWSALAGCLLASVVHAYSHVAEGRAESLTSTGGHVLADAALGLALGAALLWLGHALGTRMPASLGRRGH